MPAVPLILLAAATMMALNAASPRPEPRVSATLQVQHVPR